MSREPRLPCIIPGQANIVGRTSPETPARRAPAPMIRTDRRQQVMRRMESSSVRPGVTRSGRECRLPFMLMAQTRASKTSTASGVSGFPYIAVDILC